MYGKSVDVVNFCFLKLIFVMKKAIYAAAAVVATFLAYACKDDADNPTTVASPVQLTATLSSQTTSTSATSAPSTGTGTFSGSISRPSNVLSYTVTYSGITPTAVTLDPVSASTTSGSATYSNSILLAGAYPSTSSGPGSGTTTSPGSGTTTSPGSGTTTLPGSGTTTSPGSGTTTTPGSGTSTTPGSGTTTTPGSGTSTTPGSGTTTTPGSGTSTTPGSGTAITITSPLSGTISVSQSRADSMSRGLYRLNIRSTAYPNGEIGGTVQIR